MIAATVVGYGSIGRRHARLLGQLGCTVAVVSRRSVGHEPSFPSIAQAVRDFRPDYVIIANETSAHAASVEELARSGFRGRVLVEKPSAVGGSVLRGFAFAAVGYNLRFHPVLDALAEEIRGERLVSVQAYGGQYLPDWRPDADYRRSYSADPARGGGVLRDLSHELDYVLWLGGACRRVAALGGTLGVLEIASDECWGLLMELEGCPVASVQVNYLDRPGRRQLVINTARHTYSADIGRGLLWRDGKESSFSVEPDAMYLAQHRAMMEGDASRLCSPEQGERVMALIAAAELAAAERRWAIP